MLGSVDLQNMSPIAFLNSCMRMAYTRGFTIELAIKITASTSSISRLDVLDKAFCLSTGMEL